ncbi:MAG: MlaD family protein [Zoogloeaceae bacterium]|nr:MlaD family protein [Zoogloeaceae bacterium]
MENRAHALAAGVFTLLLGVAAVSSLFWFGSERSITVRELLVVTRQNVTGLNPEAQVRYRGIRVGKVLDIRLDPGDAGNILIRVEVDKAVPLTHGVTARLSYQGITGIAHILLEDHGRDKRPLTGNLPRVAMQPSLFDRLEDALPVMLAQGREFMENVNALLNPENRQVLQETLVNLETATGRANAAMRQMQKLFSDENIQELSGVIRESAPLMQETRRLIGQLRVVSGRVDRLLRDSEGHGDVSALAVRFNRMTGELTATSRQLKRVLQRLEEAPQSLVFGTPPGAPGPGEAGFVPGAEQ